MKTLRFEPFRALLFVFTLSFLLMPTIAHAAVPKLLTYQGVLKDGSGNYLTGTYSMVFRLYSASSGGTALWTETQSSVPTSSGKFTVQLGSVTTLNLDFNTNYWLSIKVGSDAEMSPRVRLTSSGYSIRSDYETNGFTQGQHDALSHKSIEGVKESLVMNAKTNFKVDAITLASANSMGDMIIDAFNDPTGINSAASSNYTWRGNPNYDVTLANDIDANTFLAIHANGVDASATFIDSSSTANTLTAVGDAQIDTAQSKFGGASALFDGNDYINVPSASWMNVGTGPFTIEFWVRFNSLSGSTNYILNDNNTNTRCSIRWRSGYGLETHIVSTYNPFPWSPSTGVWYHVALVRSGTSVYAFINGSKIGSTGTSSDNISSSAPITIGRNPALDGLNGWIDEFRFSNVARWTANFTPPSSEYSSGGSGTATVISNPYPEPAAPTEAMVIADETLNTGSISYYVSRNNGATWTQCIKETVTNISSQPSGTQLKWKASITGNAELNSIALAV